jgi:hypothetical protein
MAESDPCREGGGADGDSDVAVSGGRRGFAATHRGGGVGRGGRARRARRRPRPRRASLACVCQVP